MPSNPEPTQPLTDEDVRAINGRRRGAVQSLNGCDCMQPEAHGIVLDSLGDVPRLLAEVYRLRAENDGYRAAICFETTCTGCAGLLDQMVKLEAENDELTTGVKRLGNEVGVLSEVNELLRADNERIRANARDRKAAQGE